MIPLVLIEKFGPTLAKVIFWATVIVLVAGILFLVQCQMSRGVKTEAKLGKTQTSAAIQSGQDAVETLGNRMSSDAAQEQIVKETQDEIRNATDAGGVSRAGRNGLCRLEGYRRKPECLQSAPAK